VIQVKKISSRDRRVAEMIRDLQPFETYGALRATEHDGSYMYTGYLRGYDAEVYSKHKNYIRYVVWSYSTPIAWWSPAYGWHKVRQTFSVTTSRHQGQLYLCDGPGATGHRWEPFFDASLRDDLACQRERGKHVGPVGYTDVGTLCERHYLMRPVVERLIESRQTHVMRLK
jgi:hypothetical protein